MGWGCNIGEDVQFKAIVLQCIIHIRFLDFIKNGTLPPTLPSQASIPCKQEEELFIEVNIHIISILKSLES